LIMRNKTIDNSKVGLLVITGLIFLVFTLYMIGKNRNLFGSTFTIKAMMTNVNGLVPGNNVRFKGMDVGTVKDIKIVSDTAIQVMMTIDEKMKYYIRKNAIASIGTDGLMGNKLVNINSSETPAPVIEPNDVIFSRRPIETDEMLRTLNTTNNNIERISSNLYEITVKLNSSQSLWTLLSDTVITRDLKMAVRNIRDAGANTADVTLTAKNIVSQLDNGQGIAYKLFSDTTLSARLDHSIQQIQQASTQAAVAMKDVKAMIGNIQQGEGTIGLILADTVARQSLLRSVQSIEQGTGRFNENMEALKSNFLFRGYFRKEAKRERKISDSKTD
jgi:phospholipid/cholesterol/gamma-HCH transport system substrate-binding protein